ncbi:MAG: HDOD domain-containing protein [Deltaproteobacteria bacterium]|nr:HDOD domain-containing protein [Deltaproteobacteria bacterium]
MEALVHKAEVRQRILLLREIPPMPLIAQKILCMSPEADMSELSDTIEKAPEIAARLLGMANSAYFGWPGGVRTIYDAIYKVLGIKLVKSFVLGLVCSEVFDVKKCSGFRPDQYWFTAMVTAQISQSLLPSLDSSLRQEIDNIHLNGLLHNLGIAVLAHLFPVDLSRALYLPYDEETPSTTDKIRTALGMDQAQAGGWLARKWHLPRDIVCVMEHHKQTDYRGDFWPIVLLVGYAERLALQLYTDGVLRREPEFEALLGIGESALEKMQQTLDGQLDDLHAMASLMAPGE